MRPIHLQRNSHVIENLKNVQKPDAKIITTWEADSALANGELEVAGTITSSVF